MIQAHFADMTLGDLAQEFGYSEPQINGIVKASKGDIFSHLVLCLKMERTAALLSQGEDINTVSEACGYSTLSSFYRTFNGYYGCAPAHYKKEADQRGE